MASDEFNVILVFQIKHARQRLYFAYLYIRFQKGVNV